MRVAPALLVMLVPLVARADDGGGTAAMPTEQHAAVIGGTNAPDGKWPDVAAVLFDGQQGCTGTLIAPTVVLTAGHCNDASLTKVLVGTASLRTPQDGETLDVKQRVEFPSSQSTEDFTVLILAQKSKFPPRKIASGWARLDIVNGATVEIVGYGAVDAQAHQFKDELQQATTTITDADCTVQPGCNQAVVPGGELGAGGMGIDTCPGDSGGPLYLHTDYGDFLAGVTSRAYDNATTPCKDGGIYGRPDKVIDQLEQMAGVPIAHGPEPSFDKLVADGPGSGTDTKIDPNDPKSDDHTFEISTPPTHGIAKLRADGAVRVCVDPTSAPDSTDSVVVTITDKDDANRKLAVAIPITIGHGETSTACDIDAFSFPEDGGCCGATRAPGASIPLAGLVLVALRRRRRPR